MPRVLTTNAIIQCPHGGLGTSIPTNPIFEVEGGVVLMHGDTGTLACPFVLYPCVGYTLQSMNLNSTKLGTRNVMLETDFITSYTGLPLTVSEFHNTIDNSTPAPLPAGAPAPPLPPELADTSKPTVQAVPTSVSFNSTSMSPATASVVFTLFALHPLEWMMMLINGAIGQDVDVTAGIPPGLTLAPSGGGWSSSALTVTATLTALFMSGLGVGEHHLFLTGISERGLSGYSDVTISVS